jgi:uncharacterized protein (DUF362 family)/Pyruvate/2-oxoacid:ferredoxin oxidoreductase delta subunit
MFRPGTLHLRNHFFQIGGLTPLIEKDIIHVMDKEVPMPYLTITKAPDYNDKTIADAVSDILDSSGLDWAGRSVLVKPNLLGPFAPDSAVVTHPSIIRAVREELNRRGSRLIVGDNPGVRGYGMVGRTAKVSGAGEASGEDFVNITLRPRRMDLSSRHADSITISSEVLEADLLVSLPKFKTHMSTVITGAIKNSFGFVVGAEKSRLHAVAPRLEDFGELVTDIYAIRPPDLVIMDAIVGMEGNGPSAGRIREIGCILSSDSGGAIDLAMCRMTGIDPSRVATQRVAAERGLAPRTLDEVDLRGELPALHRFRPPSNLVRLDPGGRIYGFISRRLSAPQMRVDKKLCTACGVCARSCPVEAIIVDGHPVFDYHKCIACYCCYELCPEHAVKVGRLMRLVGGQ